MKHLLLTILLSALSTHFLTAQIQPESFRKIQREYYKQLEAENELTRKQKRSLRKIKSNYRFIYRDLNDMAAVDVDEFKRLRKNENRDIAEVLETVYPKSRIRTLNSMKIEA